MHMEKVFCEECRNDVAFTVTNKQMNGTIKGETYNYGGKIAHCNDCGSEIYVGEINDYNLRALYDEYRKKNDIVPLDTILQIPDKYGIGKRPISLLLGWGEQTFSRYCEGDMPTKQYSNILKKIFDEPKYYNEILEKNKGNLKTAASYEKSKKAVSAMLDNDTYKNTKIDSVISYILSKCDDITPLALQKALYYTQGFYYAFYKSFIFSEDCHAWIHGPVYRDVYFKFKDYKFDPIQGAKQYDGVIFSSAEKAIIDSISKNVCCYSGKVLEEFTHYEAPWLSARGDLSDSETSGRIIPKQQIGEYFVAVKEKYNMINPNDIREYTKAMFNRV